MPNRRLKAFLEQHQVPYSVIHHKHAITAQEGAHALHIKGHDFAKTVMVKCGRKMVMAVLPANFDVNLDSLARAVGCGPAELATEEEFASLFPDCEVGAMPPFGNLYGVEVYVANMLVGDDAIVFNAGSHTEAVQLSYQDFEEQVHPHKAWFSRYH